MCNLYFVFCIFLYYIFFFFSQSDGISQWFRRLTDKQMFADWYDRRAECVDAEFRYVAGHTDGGHWVAYVGRRW